MRHRAWSGYVGHVVFIGSVLLVGSTGAVGQEAPKEHCEGKYKDKTLTAEELTTVLADHKAWLEDAIQKRVKPNAPDERRANLCEAHLGGANLQKALLDGANLQKASLLGANLQEASLVGANLQEATLNEANLQEASLVGVNLQEASLDEANLQEAHLDGAKLQEATLVGVNLQKATLVGAQLQEVIFESVADALPVVSSIAKADGLSEITFTLPFAAVELREAFKKAGLHVQRRQLTRAINYTLTHQDLHSTDVGQWLEAAFRWVMFELPCQWPVSWTSFAPSWRFSAALCWCVPYCSEDPRRSRYMGGVVTGPHQ